MCATYSELPSSISTVVTYILVWCPAGLLVGRGGIEPNKRFASVLNISFDQFRGIYFAKYYSPGKKGLGFREKKWLLGKKKLKKI